MTTTEKHQLNADFIKAFPLESLKDMTIEQYTNLNRSDSFCYWIESKTYELGSVWGGSSYKFGIYQYKNSPKGDLSDGSFDDRYAWNSSLGKTADEAFLKVKETIIRLAECGRDGNLEVIEDIKELWPVIKWKIAFLYSNESIIPYYSLERLRVIAEHLGMQGTKNASIADIQHFLIDKREGRDVHEYAEMLHNIWNEYGGKSDERTAKVWMWGGEADTFQKGRLVCGSSVSHQMKDYGEYKDYETMRADFQKAHGNTDVSVPDAYWKFMKDVNVGDIVVVFKNKRVGKANHHTMLGWGVFTSELINDTESENPLQRLVEWKAILEEPITSGIVKNSLFFHKTTDAQAKEIMELLGITKESAGNEGVKRYWLAGYSFGSNNSQLDRFVYEGIWECRLNDDNSSDQKLLSITKNISEQDVIILKSTSTKGTNHDQPFMRIKAIGVVTSDVKTSKAEGATLCSCNVEYVNFDEKDFDGPIYGSYRKTIHQADNKLRDLIDYVNSILFKNNMAPKKYQKYIELLTENYNLVLTGAPGTGKTYMAYAIAEEMGAVTKFVQFHPSYDYTDFVEGLRPREKGDGQMGFERRDGIFKEFCKCAVVALRTEVENIELDTQTTNQTGKVDFWYLYKEIVADIKSGRLVSYPTPYKVQGLSVKNDRIVFRAKSRNARTENENNIKLLYDYFVSNNIYDLSDYDRSGYWDLIDRLTNGKTKTIDYIEYNWILQEMLNRSKSTIILGSKINTVTHPDILDSEVVPLNQKEEIQLRPFVFIIDEINRGEASKIFGELFYAIDPGYRGKKDKMVQTQYQNLVKETDVFAKGFYVPENVYILATMNDIDRSVESMDFAMRRRFTWIEVKPEDTQDMLDDLGEALAEEAKATMKRLNAAIAETEGLGAAYSIGPSYFLKLGKNGGDFRKLWDMNIEPLLKEYLRGFRKNDKILSKYREAYFGEKAIEETLSGTEDLFDEN